LFNYAADLVAVSQHDERRQILNVVRLDLDHRPFLVLVDRKELDRKRNVLLERVDEIEELGDLLFAGVSLESRRRTADRGRGAANRPLSALPHPR